MISSNQVTQWEDPALSLMWISSQPLQSPTSHQSDQSRLEWKLNCQLMKQQLK